MQRRKFIPLMAAGAAILVIGLAGITYQIAQAQTPTPTQQAPAQPAPFKGERIGPRGNFTGGVTEAELANALGITVEQLQSAQQTAMKGALDQAVSKGLITQDQANRFSNGRFGPGLGLLEANGIDYNALLAQALGISADQLQSARQTAMKNAVDSAVQAGTITQDQANLILGRQALANDQTFQNSMKSAFEAAVQQAVSSGVITQAQADQILQNSQNRNLSGEGWFGEPRGMGRHGIEPGFGFGRRGRNGSVPPFSQTPPSGSSGSNSNGNGTNL